MKTLPAPSIRLLAIDLDGTMIGNSLAISPAVKSAVRRAVERGVHVAIITGRMFKAAQPYARDLGLEGGVVCYQGAATYDAASGAKLRETPLANAIVRRIAERALADGMHVQLYRDDNFYVQTVNEFSELYAHMSRVQPIVVGSLLETFATCDSTKVVLVASPTRVKEYTPVVEALCGVDAYVTRSQPEFLEILDRDVDKGKALRHLAEHYGIPLQATMAIGDSWNDAPMLDTAAFGIAMGSAPAELMARADAVVGDVGSDGVAEAIKKYVL